MPAANVNCVGENPLATFVPPEVVTSTQYPDKAVPPWSWVETERFGVLAEAKGTSVPIRISRVDASVDRAVVFAIDERGGRIECFFDIAFVIR